ncbi:unnamed protein product [Toxocara canis]|uniref:Adenosine deaminase domain-containing protein n=1 Tax=Toxocara canis TaxID=6265 RepID=A0A3P7HDA3_TOXCA|nr:unnamed protein product [Toxocara canis]
MSVYDVFCSGCGPNSVIVGVELSGDPKYDGRKFLPLFTNAAQAGLSTTLHVAESRDHLDELYDCLQLNADRIGHGTFIHQISDVMQRARCIDYVLEMRTPIEICLTSNVTDDRGVMNCSLSGEYTIAAKTFGLSREQLFQLSVTAFKSMFIQGREDCREDVDKIASSFRRFAHLESLA